MRHASLKVLCLAALFALGSVPAQAGQLFPPENQRTGGSCTDGQVLGWSGDSVKCTNPTPGVKVSCPAGQVLAGIKQGQPDCRSLIQGCVARSSIKVTKDDCGMSAAVLCNKGEFAMTGGTVLGGNDQVQVSAPTLDAGVPVGWHVTYYDVNGSGSCTQNSIKAGTVSENGILGDMAGGVMAVCCPM